MIPKLDEYKKRWEITSENSIKPGLEAIEKALAKIGNPEKQLNIIHVAGTNGKGSTIAFMEAILQQHGFSVGVFSSPAIIDIHDQIRMEGVPISSEALNDTFSRIKEEGLGATLTDFEMLTVAAFITFERLQPDYVLLETGMGGRLDSTNVVYPLVSVITSIALDHTAFLGATIREVTLEKAGIIKRNVSVITGQLPDDALQIIEQSAKKEESPLFVHGNQFSADDYPFERKMRGAHQGINAAVAIEALRIAGVQLTESLIAKALATTQLPHRFQEIYPNCFLDGAHNPAAAKALANTVRIEFPGEKVDFIIGMLKGKDIEGVLNELIPVASSFTFLTFTHAEAATGEQLLALCNFDKKSVTTIANDTIKLFNEVSQKTIITGSLYLLASLKFDIPSFDKDF